MADASALVEVPSIVEDGEIQRAFEQLDTQMDAWIAAMKRAECALAGVRPAEPSEEAFESAVAIAPVEPAQQEQEIADQAAVALDTPMAAAPEPEAEVEEPAPQATAVEPEPESEPESAEPISHSASTGTEASAAAMMPAEPCAEPSPASGRGATASEDEALLATLDEETAKAIKVMRRMCMNTKSVSQLLTEYQAKQNGQSAAATAKKSWFRRGK